MSQIILPGHNWKPRTAQKPLFKAFIDAKFKDFRASVIAHRRFGKDEMACQMTMLALWMRQGNYLHCFPTAAQARKSLWQSVNPRTGRRRIDEIFLPECRLKTRENEMQIVFRNGSTWQCVGSDNSDALVGGSVLQIVFSEWALSNPTSWAFLSPILSENHGNAIFIGTPRGKNHAYTMHQHAMHDPLWYAETISALDNPDFDKKIIEQTRHEYTSLFGLQQANSLVDQEFLCDFNVAVLGSFYGYLISALEKEGHINDLVAYNPRYPIQHVFDLGVNDSTAIIVFQKLPDRINILDHYENNQQGLGHYVEWLRENGHLRGEHVTHLPHDAMQKQMDSTGGLKTRVDILRSMGLNCRLVQSQSVQDGISATRATLPLCYFALGRTGRLIESLNHYQVEWDDINHVFKKTPLHDWSSHNADAMRYLSLSWREEAEVQPPPPKRDNLPLNLLTYDDLLDDEKAYAWRRERI